jgi:hypothetical protein
MIALLPVILEPHVIWWSRLDGRRRTRSFSCSRSRSTSESRRGLYSGSVSGSGVGIFRSSASEGPRGPQEWSFSFSRSIEEGV